MSLRWVMLLILFLVRLAMGFQFQSVASISPHLITELGFSYAEVGTLIGVVLIVGTLRMLQASWPIEAASSSAQTANQTR